MRKSPALVLSLSLFAASGCGLLPPEVRGFIDQAGKEWNALMVVLSGGSNPLAKPSPSPSPSSSENPEYDSGLAVRAKANAQLLREMYQVVFMREPEDRSEFGSLVDSMNQGASLEGVYNGFTHSSEYRKLEAANMGSSPIAVKVFGEELALLQAELPDPTRYDEKSALPLAAPVEPGLPAGGAAENPPEAPRPTAPAPGPSPLPDPAQVAAEAQRLSKIFLVSSIYTLKRVSGDEALRVIASKKEYPEKLALWYSKWVVRIAARRVDFGLELRNRADESFHYKWALQAGEDRVTWEVLNRLHRVLNSANLKKE